MSNSNEEESRMTRLVGVRVTPAEYATLKKICAELGGIPMTNLIRMVLVPRMDRYKETKIAREFLDAK